MQHFSSVIEDDLSTTSRWLSRRRSSTVSKPPGYKYSFVTNIVFLIGGFDTLFATAQSYSTTEPSNSGWYNKGLPVRHNHHK